jgi:type I restriction enzyme S subunit
LEGVFSDLHGGVNQNIHAENIKNQFIAHPIDGQQQIVDFLDYKTGQCDRFIANRQKQIELLNEQKAAIINKVVTKGINPNAKMKPSGIEWIGDIPDNWEVIKLKYAAKLQSGETISADNIQEIGSYPVYGGNGLRGYTSNYTNDGEFILIGRQGALCGNINYASEKFWASEHAIVTYFKKPINNIWFGELLKVMNLNQYSQAAAQPGLSIDRIKILFIPFPSYQEQNKIGFYIKKETSKIETLISKYQKQIDLMQEYRTALISQAVTGKIDVRDWQLPHN